MAIVSIVRLKWSEKPWFAPVSEKRSATEASFGITGAAEVLPDP